jgi:hypothetical protein
LSIKKGGLNGASSAFSTPTGVVPDEGATGHVLELQAFPVEKNLIVIFVFNFGSCV